MRASSVPLAVLGAVLLLLLAASAAEALRPSGRVGRMSPKLIQLASSSSAPTETDAAPVAPVAELGVNAKCLASCAAQAAICEVGCHLRASYAFNSEELSLSCGQKCALDGAKCAAKCVLSTEQSTELTAPADLEAELPSAVEAQMAETEIPASLGLSKKCLAGCAVKAAICAAHCRWHATNPTTDGMLSEGEMLQGKCGKSCAWAAARCSAGCVFKSEAPVEESETEQVSTEMIDSSNIDTAFEQSEQLGGISKMCLLKCGLKMKWCKAKCLFSSKCKKKCDAKAQECGIACAMKGEQAVDEEFETDSAPELSLPEPDAVSIVAAAQAEIAPLGLGPKAKCLAGCAAKAAVCAASCVFKSENGMLTSEQEMLQGECGKKCAWAAASCATGCAFQSEAPEQEEQTQLAAAEPMIDSSNIAAAFENLETEGAEIEEPVQLEGARARCLAGCAAKAAWCAAKCRFHSTNGMLTSETEMLQGKCGRSCAWAAASCATGCAFKAEAPEEVQEVEAEAEPVATPAMIDSSNIDTAFEQTESLGISKTCLLKCGLEMKWCKAKCLFSKSCKKKCDAKAEQCGIACALKGEQSVDAEETEVETAVLPAVIIDSSNIEDAFESEVEKPESLGLSKVCLAGCAAKAAWCEAKCHFFKSENGMLEGRFHCEKECGLKAAACAAGCVFKKKSVAPVEAIEAEAAPAMIDSSNIDSAFEQPASLGISKTCLLKCGLEMKWCKAKCLLSKSCKKKCDAKAEQCGIACALKGEQSVAETEAEEPVAAVSAPAMIDSSNIDSAFEQPESLGISKTCLMKCGLKLTLCKAKCLFSKSCKKKCMAKAEQCGIACALKGEQSVDAEEPETEEHAPVAAPAMIDSSNIDAAFESEKPASLGLSKKCLAGCAAKAALCEVQCHFFKSGEGMLEGRFECEKKCGIAAAKCAAGCVFKSEAPAVLPAPESEVVVEEATKADEELNLGVNKKCIATCGAKAAICEANCHLKGDNMMVTGSCDKNCAIEAAKCTAKCAFKSEEPETAAVTIDASNVDAAFEAEADKPESLGLSKKCAKKCAKNAAICVAKCRLHGGMLQSGCDKACAVSAAKCATKCVFKTEAPESEMLSAVAPTIDSSNIDAALSSLNKENVVDAANIDAFFAKINEQVVDASNVDFFLANIKQ